LGAVDAVALGPGDEVAGLAGHVERLDEREPAGLGARGDGHLQTQAPDALGQRVTVVARLRTEGRATAHEDRGLAAAVAGAARALLRVDLGGRARHHATRLG